MECSEETPHSTFFCVGGFQTDALLMEANELEERGVLKTTSQFDAEKYYDSRQTVLTREEISKNWSWGVGGKTYNPVSIDTS